MSNASAFEMDALDSRIRELVAFARTRSDEDRSALFRNLVDLFLTGKAPKTEPTRSQLLDVVEALIPHVDSESRRTVADLVAGMMDPPADLALRLCRDRASLVANLLTHAPLDEDQIIELIEHTGREHHQIIASRDDLSANVWITLARAAPSAPPFDHRSTLALWSDDLGITQTQTARGQQAPAADVAVNANMHPVAVGSDITESPAARKASARGIRIIKTGDDLIAERLETTAQDSDTSGTDGNTLSASPAKPEVRAEKAPPRKIETPELQQFVSDDETRHPVRDPGPGGWAWQTDRDGLVISISPHGQKLFGGTTSLIGASVLDMLGLNTKIGHPVARAFQRRSTIHDAPITLGIFDKPHQHWTLEATPQFSSCGGIFEGYEGILTPVAPVKDDTLQMPTENDASAMFLDDLMAESSEQAASETPEDADEAADGLEVIGDAASSAVRDIIAETLGAFSLHSAGSQTQKVAPSNTPKNDTENVTQAHASISTETAQQKSVQTSDNTDTSMDQAQIKATFELLEEALKRLTAAAEQKTPSGVRLQGEIVAACVRSLKEQMLKN